MSDEASIAILALVGLSLACALLAHWRIRRYPAAAAVATIAAPAAFVLIDAFRLGHWPPLAPLAFAMSLLIAAPIALITGLPFHIARRRGPP